MAQTPACFLNISQKSKQTVSKLTKHKNFWNIMKLAIRVSNLTVFLKKPLLLPIIILKEQNLPLMILGVDRQTGIACHVS